VQLGKCDLFRQRRREISAYYNQEFARIVGLELPPGDSEDVEHAWHLYILRLRPELLALDRNEFIQQLKVLGVGTSVHFIPLHRHPFWAKQYGHKPQDFPNAEDAFARCLSLPIYPDMTKEQMERVAQAVAQIVTSNLRKTAVVVG
jgi:perosamine synthetase